MHRKKKGPMFKMKSGNNPAFKMMGSKSPIKKERHSDKFSRVKSEVDAAADEDKTEIIEKNYGDSWKMSVDEDGNRLYMNTKGQNMRQAAISQSPAGRN
jgi:hypothetical protein